MNIPPVDSIKNDCASGSDQPPLISQSSHISGNHKSIGSRALIGALGGATGGKLVTGSGTGGVVSSGIGGASVSTGFLFIISPLEIMSLSSFICS